MLLNNKYTRFIYLFIIITASCQSQKRITNIYSKIEIDKKIIYINSFNRSGFRPTLQELKFNNDSGYINIGFAGGLKNDSIYLYYMASEFWRRDSIVKFTPSAIQLTELEKSARQAISFCKDYKLNYVVTKDGTNITGLGTKYGIIFLSPDDKYPDWYFPINKLYKIKKGVYYTLW